MRVIELGVTAINTALNSPPADARTGPGTISARYAWQHSLLVLAEILSCAGAMSIIAISDCGLLILAISCEQATSAKDDAEDISDASTTETSLR